MVQEGPTNTTVRTTLRRYCLFGPLLLLTAAAVVSWEVEKNSDKSRAADSASPVSADSVRWSPEHDAELRGHVRDSRGDKVSNATVWAGYQSTRTNADGFFELSVLGHEDQVVYAVCEGYVSSDSMIIQLGPGEVLDNVALELFHGSRIAGRVTGLEKVDGLTVWFQSKDCYEVAETDIRGSFSIDGVRPGHYVISTGSAELVARCGKDWGGGLGIQSLHEGFCNLSEEVDVLDGGAAEVSLSYPEDFSSECALQPAESRNPFYPESWSMPTVRTR